MRNEDGKFELIKYGKVECPGCKHPITKVAATAEIRRSRTCEKCSHRFTTYEISDLDYRVLRAVLDVINQKSSDWLPGKHGGEK